ncbi:hypothetical protein KAURM247S_04690 [Kitasatospora aureofaciens]
MPLLRQFDAGVEAYPDRLRELDALIRAEGPFVVHSARFLSEARKP